MGDRFGIWGVVDFLLPSPIPISFLIPHFQQRQNYTKTIPKVFFISIIYLFLLYIYFYYIFISIYIYIILFPLPFFLSFSFTYIPSFPAITLSISPPAFSYPFILAILQLLLTHISFTYFAFPFH